MTHAAEERLKLIREALAQMPAWAKEKARRYHAQQEFAERTFGPVVKFIEEQRKKRSK